MRAHDPNAEKIQTSGTNSLQATFAPWHTLELQDGERAHTGASGTLVGKGLAQSKHRDGYSPTGRSSGRVTDVMLDKNVGATLAATIGAQSTGTSGHHCKD